METRFFCALVHYRRYTKEWEREQILKPTLILTTNPNPLNIVCFGENKS